MNKMGALTLTTLLASAVGAAQWSGGGSNEIFDPANWGGTTLDGTTDATFWGGEALSLVMSEDHTIKTMPIYGRTMTVDFQGKTMTVSGGDIRPMRGAKVTFTNGVVTETTGTLRVGQEGANSLLTLTGSTFSMSVPSSLIGQGEGTSFSGIVVENGASLTINNNMPFANTYTHTSNNYARVTGEGSKIYVPGGNVTIGHQGIGGNNWVEVADKGLFTCGKTMIGNHAECPNNLLRITDGGAYTNNGDFAISSVANSNGNRIEVLDGGDLYVRDNFYIASNGSIGNALVISNASVTVGKQVLLAGNGASSENEIRVIDGTLTASTGFRFCWGTEAEGNRVVISNGCISTAGILLGKNDPAVVKDNRIVFCGDKSRWTVSGTDISLKSGATLEVDFPVKGRDPSVVCLQGLDANLNLDGTMRIVVNAEKYARQLSQTTTYPLVRVKSQIAATALDHVTVDLPDYVIVSLTSDKKGIDITVKPARKGLIICVR